MARKRRTAHVDDDRLLALVDDEATAGDAEARTHVAGCNSCSARITRLRAMRHLLHEVGPEQVRPEHDIAQRAIGRLRLRKMAIGNMNEVFAAVRALLRGLADILGGGGTPDVNSPRRDEGIRRG